MTVTAVSARRAARLDRRRARSTSCPTRTCAATTPGASTTRSSDGHGGTDTGTVTVDITCVNDPPVAVDDTETVDEDAAATAVDVLANDTDAESDPITIASVDPARQRHRGDHRRSRRPA